MGDILSGLGMGSGWRTVHSMRFQKPSMAVWACVATLLAPWLPRALALERTAYCNAVQNRTGFIRYPLGTIAAWSTAAGESADVMTRVPRIYPCLNVVVAKSPKEDWRASITGDPSLLTVTYQTNKPAGATRTALTVSPHTTIYRVTFPAGPAKKFLVFDFGKGTVDDWAALSKWTDRELKCEGSQALAATVGPPGGKGAFYALKFNAPCTGWGALEPTGQVIEGDVNASGPGAALYAQFDVPTVEVAVAASFSGMKQAEAFLATESGTFESVHGRCREAWEQVLGRLELEGTDGSQRMAYSALYTMYANLINGDDGSCYQNYCPRPRSLASSAYWQFIGGFQSCCWDNFRTAYPVLMLTSPEVMSDVVKTYQARYERDGCMDGNICLFSGPTGGHRNVRFSPVLVAQALQSGIEADYSKMYAALKANFDNGAYVPGSLATLGYATQPNSGGKACSETLEFATSAASMALLAEANHDPESARKYAALSKCYTNLWDRTNHVFRVRNADGGWGMINNTNWTWNPNPQGLFEGTSPDWMFSVPHDPYGLMGLPGQERFVERVTQYCLNDTWFNDYQYHYPYLLYYAGAANECQRIIRTAWVPLFQAGVMFEGVRPKPPHNGWQTHYTSNAGWLLCSMLGLYPVPAPAGQFILCSPSVAKATIHHGAHDITLSAPNNNETNLYISSIKVDGKVYPAYMIPAKRLVSGVNIELDMGSNPSQGLGELYVASTDGLLHKAELASRNGLRFTVESGLREGLTKIHSRTRPASVSVNALPASQWDYDEAGKVLTLRTTGTAAVEVLLP